VAADLKAFVGQNASITVAGDITVQSAHNYTLAGATINKGAGATAIAPSGGLIAGAGADADALSAAVVDTFVNANATLRAGGDIRVLSLVHNDAEADATGAAGGLIGVGASLADATVGGTTKAHVDGNITDANNLFVQTTTTQRAEADGQAVSGGLAAGAGADIDANVNPTVQAFLGNGANITVDTDVTVSSQTTADANASALGVSIGAVAIAVSLADATLEPTIDTFIGNAQVNAGRDISVIAAHNYTLAGAVIAGGATANATTPSGGALAGAGADTNAIARANVEAFVSGGASLNANRDIFVSALSSNDAEADATGIAGGIVGIGATLADATSQGTTSAHFDGDVTDGRDLSVRTTTNELADARSIGVSGGIVAGASTDSDSIVNPTVRAFVGNGANILLDRHLNVSGQASADSTALAAGVSIGGVAIGVSNADAVLEPDLETSIGNATVTTGGGIFVTSAHNYQLDGNLINRGASANATTPAGGLIAGSGADANAFARANVDTFVNGGATLSAGGDIAIVSWNNNDAEADGTGVAGGLVGIGSTLAGATSGGTTTAQMNGAVSDGNSLAVRTFTSQTAEADSRAVAGGIIAGSGSAAEATVNPTIRAFVGNGGSVDVDNDVAITSEIRTDADADARGVNAGVVAVGISQSDATINADIETSAGQNTVIRAGRDIVILSAHNYTLGGGVIANSANAYASAPAGGLIAAVGADADAVTTGNTDTFARAGALLDAGRDVTVKSLANNVATSHSIGIAAGIVGIGASRADSRVTGTTRAHIDDGATVEAGQGGNAGNLDVIADGRNVANAEGDATSGGLIGVATTSADTTVTVNTDAFIGDANVTTTGDTRVNALSQGDATSHADGVAGGLGAAGLVDATATLTGDVQAHVNNGATITAGNNSVAGDLEVRAQSVHTSFADADGTAVGLIGATANVAEATTHVGVNAFLGDITAVVGDNVVVQATADNDSTSRADGLAAGLGAVGASRADATVRGGIEAHINSGANVSAGTPARLSDITIVAEAFNYLTASNATNTADAAADATAAGLVGIVPGTSANSTMDVDFRAFIGDATLTATDDILIDADSRNNALADADAFAAGLFAAGFVDARATMGTMETIAEVRAGASLNAGGGVTIRALSKNDANVSANAGQGGLLAVGGSSARASLTNRTRAEIGDNASVVADGVIDVRAESRFLVTPHSTSNTPIAAITTNESGATATVDSETVARIGANANVVGGDVSVTATDVDGKAQAFANAGGLGFGAFSDAFGTVDATVLAKVIVASGANIEANGTGASLGQTTIAARQELVNTKTDVRAASAGGFGGATGKSTNLKVARADVNVAAGVDITTHDLDVEAFAHKFETEATKLERYEEFVEVDLDTLADLVLDAAEGVLTVAGEIVCLWGLICDAEGAIDDGFEAVRGITGNSEVYIYTLDQGLPGPVVESTINFNADVTITGGAAPEAEIDAAGRVTKADNVTVRDGNGNVVPVGGIVSTPDIVIDAIINDDPQGTIRLEAEGETAGHSNFFFNTAFDHVTILNQSAKNLIVNNIDVSQIPGTPPIQIIGAPNNFTYDVFTNAVDTDVSIENTNAANRNIILRGHIENQGGVTVLNNAGGGILSEDQDPTNSKQFAETASYVRTREIRVDAAGTIGRVNGLNTERLFVRIARSLAAPTPGVELLGDDGVYVDVTLGVSDGSPLELTLGGQGETAGDIDRIESISGDVDIRYNGAIKVQPNKTVVPATSTLHLGQIAAAGNITVLAFAGTKDAIVASSHIRIDETVSAPNGKVAILTRRGNIEAGAPGHLIVAEDVALVVDAIVVGGVVMPDPGVGHIGTSLSPIRINQQASSLDARASEDIFVTEISGSMTVGDVTSTQGNVTLNVIDGSAGHLLLPAGSSVSTPQGSSFLNAGDNVTFAVGATISAGVASYIKADYQNTEAAGSQVEIHGTFDAPFVEVRADEDVDTFNLTSAPDDGVMFVIGGRAADQFTISIPALDSATLVAVFGDLPIGEGAPGEDDDVVDASGSVLGITIDTGGGQDLVTGGQGNDRIALGGGHDIVNAGDGDDLAYGDAYFEIDVPTRTVDPVYSARQTSFFLPLFFVNPAAFAGADILYGNDGNDELHGDGNEDKIFGQDGDDSLFGGSGRDFLLGDIGNDNLDGGSGDDFLSGGIDTGVRLTLGDLIRAEFGDYLDGASGNDLVIGGQALGYPLLDNLVVEHFKDLFDSNSPNPLLVAPDDENEDFLALLATFITAGSDGSDIVHGGHGNDLMTGEEGADNLFGDYGNDVMFGYRIGSISATDEDRLEGGPDNDDPMCGTLGVNVMIGGTSDMNLDYILSNPGAPSGGPFYGGYGITSCVIPDPVVLPVLPVSIAGQKFKDLDGDGVKGPGEPGLNDWVIELYDEEGELIATTVTASVDVDSSGDIDPLTEMGLYSFTDVSVGGTVVGLNPGVYHVAEVQQADFLNTLPFGSYTVTLPNGGSATAETFTALGGLSIFGYTLALDSGPDPADVQTAEDIDFGNIEYGEIHGTKWEDIDGDGVFDPEENILAGWTIVLVNDGGFVDVQVTDEFGQYHFTQLLPDTYSVVEFGQLGWVQTFPSTGFHSIDLSFDEVVNNVDFGNAEAVFIDGTKYEDLDGDGVLDRDGEGKPTEPALAGWTIYLDQNQNGALDAGELSTITDAFGGYRFDNLKPGTYYVAEVAQAGWQQSFDNTTLPGGVHEVTLLSGQFRFGADFLNYRRGSIAGFKWHDIDADGTLDLFTEPLLEGWTIYLDLNENGQLDDGEPTDVTDDNGLFSFENLRPGNYVIGEVVQSGWTQTFPEPAVSPLRRFVPFFRGWVPSLNDLDGGRDPRFHHLAVSSGESDFAAFGNTQRADIFGTKYEDLDGDGQRDAGEPGLPGWRVWIDVNGNGSRDTFEPNMLTREDDPDTDFDEAGAYSFLDMPARTYTIYEEMDVKWLQSRPGDPRSTPEPQIVLNAVGNVEHVDFANLRSGEIHGQKFNDINGDGQRNSDENGVYTEPGLAGWTIYVDLNNNGILDVHPIFGIPLEPFTITAEDDLTTVLDETGAFSFQGLLPGDYRIREVLQAGWKQTTPGLDQNGSHDATIRSGDLRNRFNFGNVRAGGIGGTKWWDLNADGKRQDNEPGLAGWTIYVDLNNNGQLDRDNEGQPLEPFAITQTDNPATPLNDTGAYAIPDVPAGSYVVSEELRPGWTRTYPSDPAVNGHKIDLLQQQVLVGIDFGNTIFGDCNGDRRVDGEDVADFQEAFHSVRGQDNYNSCFDSDRDGDVDFVDLFNFRQNIGVEIPPVPQNSEADDDGGAGGGDPPGTLTGTKWNDLDGDGKQAANEPGLPGWTIYLDLNHNRIFDRDALGNPLEPFTITTEDDPQTEFFDEAGRYRFERLELARYEVAEVAQAGWTQTFPTPRSRFGFDDLALGARFPVGRTLQITSTDGYLAQLATEQFFFSNGTPTNNGVMQVDDNSQAGDAGQELQVNNINLRFDFTSTMERVSIKFGYFGGNVNLAVNGDFRNVSNFAALNGQTIGGAMVVVVSTPGAPFGTIELIGDVDSFTIGGQELFVDLLTVQRAGLGVHVVDLRQGSATGRDFGNRLVAGGISGTKWNDVDGDGSQDDLEDGLPGWTIYVDLNNNRQFDAGEPFDITNERGAYFIQSVPAGEHAVGEVPQEGWKQTFPAITPVAFRFEDLPSETNYSVGETFTTTGALGSIATAVARPFIFSDGTPFEEGQASVGPSGANGSGQGLFLGNINLSFTFNTVVDVLVLRYGDFGGSFNVSINGDFRNVKNLLDLNGQTIGGAQIVVNQPEGAFGIFGVLGNVTSFAIGGQEFAIDDLTIGIRGLGVHVVTVTPDENVTGIDFGNQRTNGRIFGTKWNDTNGDGRRTDDEQVLAGWTIYLDLNNNGQFDEGEPNDVTDENGAYSFTGLAADTYTVAEVLQEGWEQTYPDAPLRVFGFEDLPLETTYTVGETFDTVGMFGAVAHATMEPFFFVPGQSTSSGFAQVENEGNAGDEGHELLVNNINLTFTFDAAVSELSIRFADFGGSENLGVNGDLRIGEINDFDGLNIGGAQVTVIQDPESNLGTIIVQGAITSFTIGGQEFFIDLLRLDQGGPGVHVVEVGPETTIEGLDFGNRQPECGITGTKFEDLDGDGVRDPQEPGLPGVIIYLDLNNNGILDRDANGRPNEPFRTTLQDNPDTRPDESGRYFFDGLDCGTYIVREEVPDGYVQTVPVVSFTGSTNYDVGNVPVDIASGDFNGDGFADLATANASSGNVSILINDKTGHYLPAVQYNAGAQPSALIAADLDGDLDIDLAVSVRGKSAVAVLFNNGAGVFALAAEYQTGNVPEDIAAGDFDGDGDIDVATANIQDSSVTVLLNAGNGSFGAPEAYDVPALPTALVVADFNNDHFPDLAVTSLEIGAVTVLLNKANGEGTFGALGPFDAGFGSQSIAAGDFDQNGDIDLAVGNQSGDGGARIAILMNQGGVGASVSFAEPVTFFVANNPAGIAVGDFNGDEYPDLAVTDSATGEVLIVLNTQQGAFGDPISFPVGTSPGAVVTEDLNNDNLLDLAVANVESNNVTVLLLGGEPGAHVVELPSGTIATGRDFGNFREGIITGQKFHDMDCAGDRDENDPGLAGVTIYIDANNNGEFDAGELFGVTGENGFYVITGVGPGTHVVREVVPDGYFPSFPASGVHLVTMAVSGQTIAGIDFGNFTKVVLPDGDDYIYGHAGDDILYGDNVIDNPCVVSVGGKDHLYGLEGNDTLIGQLNDDTYHFLPAPTAGSGDEIDTVVELPDAGTDEPTDEGRRDRLDFSALGPNEPVIIDLSGTPPASFTEANQIAEHRRTDGTSDTHKVVTDVYENFANFEQLVGGASDDILVGNDRDNLLDGRDGSDYMQGGAGDDTYVFVLGNPDDEDEIIETIGSDTLDFSLINVPVIVDLSTPPILLPAPIVARYGTPERTVTSTVPGLFENVIGTQADDIIRGSDEANSLAGSGGEDQINGLGGDDELLGGADNDDYLFENNWGNDTIIEFAGEGDDDTLDFSAVTVDLVFTVGLGFVTATDGVNLATHPANNIERLIGGTGNDTLVAADTPNTWIIDGVNSGTLNGVHFSDMNNLTGGADSDTFIFLPGGSITGSIDGGLGDDLILGDNVATIWNIIAADTGNAGMVALFLGIENLLGGLDVDQFNFADAATLTGNIDGGDGDDVFDYTAYSTPVEVNLPLGTSTGVGSHSHIERFLGGTASDTLIGYDIPNIWNITALNAGTIGGVTFDGFENLTGGVEADAFVFADGAGVNGVIDGGAGSDTLDYSAYTTAVEINLGASTATGTGGVADIENAIGGTASDTLIGPDAATTWNITALDAGDVAGITFSSFENLSGGLDEDSFIIADAAGITGTIDGGDGSDTLDLSAATTPVEVNLNANTATSTGGIANLEVVIGGGDVDTLIATDVVNLWTLSGTNAGTVNSVAFQSFENLTGGIDADAFDFGDGAAIDGLVDGGDGNDTLDYTAYNANVEVDLQNATATGTAGIANIESFIGGAGDDSLIGANVANAWNLSAANAGDVNGVTFSNFENLTGGTDVDAFTLADAATLTGTIDGGDGDDTLDYAAYTTPVEVALGANSATGLGSFANIESFIGGADSDTLVGDDIANAWDLTGANAGDVNGVNFTGFENLTGGTDADSFTFADAATIDGVLDGGDGDDAIDYSAYATPVEVNLELGTATGTGGIANIENFLGGAGSDTFIGPNAANTWNISAQNAGDVNGVTFASFENLTGGTLDDLYIFADGVGVDAVLDGEAGTDTLDYSAYTTPAEINLAAGTATGTGGIEDIEGCLDCTVNLTRRVKPRSSLNGRLGANETIDQLGPANRFDLDEQLFDFDDLPGSATDGYRKADRPQRDELRAIDELMHSTGKSWWGVDETPAAGRQSKPNGKRRLLD